MTVTYTDPYKDNPYGKLKGEKQDCLIKINFDQCKFLKEDDVYWLVGQMTSIKGVVRAYKAELAIEPGLLAVPVYGSEYEIPVKNKETGKYDGVKAQASIYEKALYKFISNSEDTWIGNDKNFKGSVNFLPNMMCEGEDDTSILVLIEGNLLLSETDAFVNLPEFPVYSNNSFKKGGKTYGLKPEEKVEFFIKQMQKDVLADSHKSNQCLADMILQIMKEHQDNPKFIDVYFETLNICAR